MQKSQDMLDENATLPTLSIDKAPVILFSIIFTLLIIFLVFVVFHYSSGLFPQPEQFSELYFSNPTALNHTVMVGHMVSFAFKIHDLEGHRKNYVYQVSLLDVRTTVSVTSVYEGTVEIDDNATQELTVKIPVAKDFTGGKVQVQLLDNGQSISYQLNAEIVI